MAASYFYAKCDGGVSAVRFHSGPSSSTTYPVTITSNSYIKLPDTNLFLEPYNCVWYSDSYGGIISDIKLKTGYQYPVAVSVYEYEESDYKKLYTKYIYTEEGSWSDWNIDLDGTDKYISFAATKGTIYGYFKAVDNIESFVLTSKEGASDEKTTTVKYGSPLVGFDIGRLSRLKITSYSPTDAYKPKVYYNTYGNNDYTYDNSKSLSVPFSISDRTYNRYIMVGEAKSYKIITATMSDVTWGTVSGGGTYEVGSSCTVEAKPNAGYAFSKWTINNTTTITTAKYTFNVDADATFRAYFEAGSTTLKFASNNTDMGTVSASSITVTTGNSYTVSGNKITYGSQTVTATKVDTYKFDHWINSSKTTVTDGSYTISGAGETLTAVFISDASSYYTYSLTLNTNAPSGFNVNYTYSGSTALSGTIARSKTVTILASDIGQKDSSNAPYITGDVYKFMGWNTLQDGSGSWQKTNITLSYSSTSTGTYQKTLYAIWAKKVNIVITADPVNACTISNTSSSVYTLPYTITADEGATWSLSSTTLTVKADGTYTFKPTANSGYEAITSKVWDTTSTSGTISSDTTFTAKYQGETYTLSFKRNGGEYKDTATETKFKNKTVTYNTAYGDALPVAGDVIKDNYTFSGWSLDDATMVSSETLVTKPSSGSTINLTAVWEPITYYVAFKSVSSSIEYQTLPLKDLKLTIPYTPDPRTDYIFNGWDTKEDGSGTRYRPGDVIEYKNHTEEFDSSSHTLTLYEQWMLEPPLKVWTDKGYKEITDIYVNIDGGTTWKPIEEWYAHDGTGWKKMLEK